MSFVSQVMYHQRTTAFSAQEKVQNQYEAVKGHVLQCTAACAFHVQDVSKSFAGLLYPFNLLISLHVSCCCPPQLAMRSTSLQAPVSAQGAVSPHTGMLSVRGKAWACRSWKGYGDGSREAEAEGAVLCNNSQLCCYN